MPTNRSGCKSHGIGDREAKDHMGDQASRRKRKGNFYSDVCQRKYCGTANEAAEFLRLRGALTSWFASYLETSAGCRLVAVALAKSLSKRGSLCSGFKASSARMNGALS